MKKYIAVDLGASSGRIIVGDLSGIEVVSRFGGKSVQVGRTIYWDILAIFQEIKRGIKKAFDKYGSGIAGIGLDSWGVDYLLLDETGEPMGNPLHYRDLRTDGLMEEFFKIIPAEEVYGETGIQLMQINTLFQLFAEKRNNPRRLNRAAHYLSIPDLLNYWLTGVKKNEFSHATTTQLYNPTKRCWSEKLIRAVGADPGIFGEVVEPGYILGPLLPGLAKELGAPPSVRVIAPACHDTASAVAAVPSVDGKSYAYLSSGTWSLLGIEASRPIITEDSFRANFTNEGGMGGRITFLKNIMGLWILQECKAAWDEEGRDLKDGPLDWPGLVQAAEEAPASDARIDVDDPLFLKPASTAGNMPDRIRRCCAEAGLHRPRGVGEIVRCLYTSLADIYASTLEELEKLSGERREALYIIGGGCQNDFLNRLTAEAVGRRVYAGPVEAAAAGNILIQAVALGDVASPEEGRRLIAENFDLQIYRGGNQ